MNLALAFRKRFAGLALEVAFEAPASGITALIGPSGAGKSTILKAIAGLIAPDDGAITLNGTTLFDARARIDIPVHRRRIGVVFQDARLFAHLTIAENLAFGAKRLGGDASRTAIEAMAEQLAIAPLLKRRPAALSGGEKQRVALGRALLTRPRALLLDEPLAALDQARKSEIIPHLNALRSSLGVPIILVSHNLDDVLSLADHLVMLKSGQIVAAGELDTLLADPALAAQLGHDETLLQGTIARHHHGAALTDLLLADGRMITLPRLPDAIGTRIRARLVACAVTPAFEKGFPS